MVDLQEFLSKKKSLLIAPAGYGKTHTIAMAIKLCAPTEHCLILTHTNAGVASIKEKMAKLEVAKNLFHIETIAGFSEKYTKAYYVDFQAKIANSADKYFDIIGKLALELFRLKAIRKTLKNSFSIVFVDEYQDCSVDQHKLIELMSNEIPTHLLGDPLQGIFSFHSGGLVDLNSHEEMKEFKENEYYLQEPYRWMNSGSSSLGRDLAEIRNCLTRGDAVDLRDFKSITVNIVPEIDLYRPQTNYSKAIWKLAKQKNVLILHPESTTIQPRLKFVSIFGNLFSFLETIDSKDFHKAAELVDQLSAKNVGSRLLDICELLFTKTSAREWLGQRGPKTKKDQKDRLAAENLHLAFSKLEKSASKDDFYGCLDAFQKLPQVKCRRRELLYALQKATNDAIATNSTVQECMEANRNISRKVGRTIEGRCIGTTLLTKGLEFETVAVLNAHRFTCRKHLYVALTRATNNLTIFSQQSTLLPY